jgi:hypothetical protein
MEVADEQQPVEVEVEVEVRTLLCIIFFYAIFSFDSPLDQEAQNRGGRDN